MYVQIKILKLYKIHKENLFKFQYIFYLLQHFSLLII